MKTIITVLLMFSSAADSAVVQAAFELEGGVEDLIERLIEKLNSAINPKHNKENVNVGQELLGAVLQVAPLVTLRGNISYGGESVLSVSFRLVKSIEDAEAAAVALDTALGEFGHLSNKSTDCMYRSEDEMLARAMRGGVLAPLVSTLEPYLVSALMILLQALLGNLVTHIMHETSMLTNVSFV